MRHTDSARVIWRDKTTGEECTGSGAMFGWYASHPERYEQTTVPRFYHVVVIVERTGRKIYMTETPVSHEEGCRILSKITPYSWRRKQLEEVTP